MSEASDDPTATLGRRPREGDAARASAPRHACIKVLTGSAAGLLLRLDMDEATMGRGTNNDLILEDSLISRVHARLTKTAEGILITDLESKNGTFVQGQAIKSRLLEEGDEILVGGSVILNFTYVNPLEEDLHNRLYAEANLDALTGVLTRRAFMSRLQWEIELAGPRQLELTVAILDADHFKKVNDTYGHPAGDAVLKELAVRVRRTLRSRDCFGRYGGEEFAMLLPELPIDLAQPVLDRVRREIALAPFEVPTPDGPRSITVTVSIGAAPLPTNCTAGEDVVKNADQALYWAKEGGRNLVKLFRPEDDNESSTLAGEPPS